MYSKPACVQCEWTEKYLQRKELAHNVIDTTDDEDARKVVEDSGILQMPMVVVKHDDGTPDTWHGFNVGKLKGLHA